MKQLPADQLADLAGSEDDCVLYVPGAAAPDCASDDAPA
jgi:hypothetical protein